MTLHDPADRRTIVAIGGSAGARAVVQTLVDALPSDHPLSVLIVLHRARAADSTLEAILSAQSRSRVRQAEDGDPIRAGTILIAPPDRHLLVDGDGICRLSSGPRENMSRPAIDPLMRSLGVFAGPRAVGVVLSGYLHDGAAGLAALRRCGGLTVVQDPVDADYPDMPRAALDAVGVPDHLVAGADLAGVLMAIAQQAAGAPVTPPDDVVVEAKMAAQGGGSMALEDSLGTRSPITCPHCQGVLWQMKDPAVLRFRCHTGHAYTAADVFEAQTRRVEEALWSATRAHRERAETARRLAEGTSSPRLREMWEARRQEAEAQADLLRSVLVGHTQG